MRSVREIDFPLKNLR